MNRFYHIMTVALIVVGLYLAGMITGTAFVESKSKMDIIDIERKPLPQKLLLDTMSDETMFRLICLQEGGGAIRLNAWNEKEGAIGPAQIRECYLADANEWLKWQGQQPYTMEDMVDYYKAFRVCVAYWARYKLLTLEERARGHCSGPDGPYQDNSLAYWESCKQYLTNDG